ncbi:uncharacterized protein DCS_05896 [Drechmeria coniospora]|uniref:Reverse transcriptase domain-containing protein n=1 Tax=Drechmeria coniospora TaxID=98403 RepID=A0A151GA36_DRECN|nr:uncharacterized protein DCS_05896 [Drechmeria coniospora]KYK53947.1 uncharacterized protein DCS_05896 [Drechmeria coniospora]
MVRVALDIDGWESPAVLYVVPGLSRDAILGLPWIEHRGVDLHAAERRLTIGAAGGQVVQAADTRPQRGSYNLEIATVSSVMAEPESQAVVTNLMEISAALRQVAPSPEPSGTEGHLPAYLKEFADLFDKAQASGLPPHRGLRDHHIKLQTGPNGEPPELPWGPLYNMPRDQLLEVRQQITELLDKGWIRTSSSAAAAPILLTKKPGGGWRLCVDYRALNKITIQDRYPLPLIKETLRSLSGSRWFTKLDVRAAFHKIRIAPGSEHLTAFRTRFGLFEWLVCPFGLAGAPAIFQRYINGVLGTNLGNFVTAFLDDILVYTSGSKADHIRKVKGVLQRLREVGLYLDLDKCAFAVKEVKYLGYIVQAGVEIRTDPAKIAAIRNWEAPRTVRGFAELTAPLSQLTCKGQPFRWTTDEDNAFEELKRLFISHPILAQWDAERPTFVEADCSGTALGGCLLQVDEKGILRPVAYHSAKLTAAERNYTIHDKELLAVVRCLEAWQADLRGVSAPFTVLTDHKNLEYFTRPREISERQARWAEKLSQFNFHLQYRPGS